MSSEHISDITVIGDVHGRTLWRQIVNDNPRAHIVFMGDYCDPYEYVNNDNLIDNLNEIIRIKQREPERITLLLGNHDMHYFVRQFPRGSRYDWRISEDLRNTFESHKDLFCYAWQYGGILFTHAGVSRHWTDECLHTPLPCDAAGVLNSFYNNVNERNALYNCGRCRLGDDAYGGIFWADIKELDCLPSGIIQVAGHNRVRNVTCLSDNDAHIFLCDCLEQGRYLNIKISDGKISFYERCINSTSDTLIMEDKHN